ncbi:MAG: hypothetical protein M3P91_02815 [Actinomycetota bacterium]|nr:hypothetical protein [Actinomycetota bacterium]
MRMDGTPELHGIAAFDGQAATMLWTSSSLPCAIYFTGNGFSGYVQLPPDHPDRIVAEAYDIMEKSRIAEAIERGMARPKPLPAASLGHDAVRFDVPGGLTYGPDDEGWIGFSTDHAWERWEPEEIRRHLPSTDPRRQYWEQSGELGLVRGPGAGMRNWTLGELVRETEKLARQVAAGRRFPRR